MLGTVFPAGNLRTGAHTSGRFPVEQAVAHVERDDGIDFLDLAWIDWRTEKASAPATANASWETSRGMTAQATAAMSKPTWDMFFDLGDTAETASANAAWVEASTDMMKIVEVG